MYHIHSAPYPMFETWIKQLKNLSHNCFYGWAYLLKVNDSPKKGLPWVTKCYTHFRKTSEGCRAHQFSSQKLATAFWIPQKKIFSWLVVTNLPILFVHNNLFCVHEYPVEFGFSVFFSLTTFWSRTPCPHSPFFNSLVRACYCSDS